MFETTLYKGSKHEQYELLIKQLSALIEDEPNQIANLSNASALLNQFLNEVNWVGFYLLEGKELVLGPFQGLPACVRIQIGKGVCGTAVKERQSIMVADVNKFPGHIFCDAASKSEIVIPIFKSGEIFGVLDIDSPITDRFDETDKLYLEKFIKTLEAFI